MNLGEAVRRFRDEHRITQRDLADVLGMTPSNVGEIERGGITMRSDLIGKLRGTYPELWKTLAAIRIDEERRALGIDTAAPGEIPESAILILRKVYQEVGKEIERLEQEPSGRRKTTRR